MCASILAALLETWSEATDPVFDNRAQIEQGLDQRVRALTPSSVDTDEQLQRTAIAPPPLAGPLPISSRQIPKGNLSLSTSIEGRCLDADGEAFPGAVVALTRNMPGRIGMPVIETTADREGYFRFEQLKAFETYVLCAVAPNRPYAQLEARPGESVELKFQSGAALTGQVLEEQSSTPLGGVRVWNASLAFPNQPGLADWLESFKRVETSTTDSNGRFEISGLHSGTKVQLAAELNGFLTEHKLVAVNDPTSSIHFLLPAGKRVRYRVVDWETGQPLAGATVGFASLHTGSILTADQAGEFEWTVSNNPERNRPWNRVSVPGYCAMQVDLDAAALTSKRPEIRMVRGVKVGGRVFDPGGKYLPHAVVTLTKAEAQSPPLDCNLPSWQIFHPGPFGSKFALSNDNGYFEFRDLVPRLEPRSLFASHFLYFTLEGSAVVAEKPNSSLSRDLHLEQGGAIQGRVTLLGEAYAARIELRGPGKSKRYANAGSDGLYQVNGLRPGEWEVRFKIKPKAKWIQCESRTLQAGEVLPWDSELYPHGTQTFSGRLAYSDGAPIANNVVYAKPGRNSFASDASCKTNANGFFTMELPIDPESQWQFNATVHSFVRYSKRLKDSSESIELEFPRLGKVGFRLIEQGSGNTLSLHSLGWRDSDSQRWTSLRHQVFKDGVYWIHLPLGLVDLRATTNTSRHYEGTLSNVPVTSAHSQVWDLVLERGILLEIQFASADGIAGLPYFGQPKVEILGVHNGITYGTSTGFGSVTYTPLKPGQIRIVGNQALEFEPSLLDIHSEQEQVRQVTWRITDLGLYEQLREEHELMQDNLELIGCGY